LDFCHLGVVSYGRSVRGRCCGSTDGRGVERGYFNHKKGSSLRTHPREQHRNLKLFGSSGGGDKEVQHVVGSAQRGDRAVGESHASW